LPVSSTFPWRKVRSVQSGVLLLSSLSFSLFLVLCVIDTLHNHPSIAFLGWPFLRNMYVLLVRRCLLPHWSHGSWLY
jgi:hypothetical protein